MTLHRSALALVALIFPVLASWSAGCGGSGATGISFGTGGDGSGNGASGNGASGNGASGNGASGNGASGNSSSGFTFGTGGSSGSGPTTQCTGLQCQVHACSGGGSTTISGTIYDPAGKNPLYGVVAYVPNTKPDPLTSGVSCYSCADLYTGNPVAAAISDVKGNFTIQNVPDGQNIPLVIQVGKWRRQFTIPSVAMCTNTALPGTMLTLPKNSSEGDLPNIAVSTGGADTLECLLSRVGVDKAEYVPGAAGNGHVHIFQGRGGPTTSPAAPVSSQGLWSSAADIDKYDIVMLSCEGSETANTNQQVLFDYAAKGGRVFASHFHYAWFNTGPFGSANLATWTTGSQSIGNINASVVTTDWNGMTFDRGQALHDWLQNVNALTNNLLPIDTARQNANVTMANTPSQPWLVRQGQPTHPQDFSFDTPIGATPDMQCGRVVYSDMHVGAASGDYTSGSQITPTGCANKDLSPQEKALEFILFDLSSCVTPNNMPQQPPPTQTQ